MENTKQEILELSMDLSKISTQELLTELGKRQLEVVLREKYCDRDSLRGIYLFTPLSNSFPNIHDFNC